MFVFSRFFSIKQRSIQKYNLVGLTCLRSHLLIYIALSVNVFWWTSSSFL
ncbi:hypothetical protein EHQ31_18745 [Leptospira montravelensis]|uniref:Uncharacterized protein n=1 Tax=Leptospira montravelensis TaxID=2484961 RepID=A0ABY2LPY5_9LEPT|nr:hypothetical protein EHQ19_08445 [Leptospira montravelensis]TGK95003.1 hypothetical protein EHQ31_18745 [Leptospira montravelensis]